jgi:predicted transcriptional regulator
MLMLLEKSLTLEDAARHIINGHERTLVFHDEDKKLIGVISQGDILRAIWNGMSVISPILDIINYNPIVIDESKNNKFQIAIEHFVQVGALVIPVVNEHRIVIDVIRVREILDVQK